MHPGDIVGHEFMGMDRKMGSHATVHMLMGEEKCATLHAGIVEEVGEDVHKLQKGQRVAVSFCIVCGECEYCKRGLWTSCETTNNSLVCLYRREDLSDTGHCKLVSWYV